jgi:hypothetical protein
MGCRGRKPSVDGKLAQRLFVEQCERPGPPRGGCGSSGRKAAITNAASIPSGLPRSDDHDTARPVYAPRLAERDNGIAGVLERVENRDHIETAVVERQLFEIAVGEITLRRALRRDGEKRLSGIDAGHLRTAHRGHLCRHPRATAYIEIACARSDAGAFRHGFIDRTDCALLVIGPISGTHPPEPPIDLGCSKIHRHGGLSPGGSGIASQHTRWCARQISSIEVDKPFSNCSLIICPT